MSQIARASKHTKIKAGVAAIGVAAVIAVGALTGAQLKQDRQKEETIRQFRETTPRDQIASLEQQRAHLVEQKDALQRKLDLFLETAREREAEKQAKAKR